MAIEAIIILILACLGLVAGIIYLFVRSDFPKFKNYKEGQFGSVKARIWAETPEIGALIDELTVAKAAWAVQAAWNDLGMKDIQKVRDVLKEVALCATTDATFPRYAFYQANLVSSVQVWTKDKIFNKNIPMCVIHESVLRRRSDAESAFAIHEYIHAVADKVFGSADHKHENEELWTTLTNKAMDFYVRY